jgi:hypothetical protein
MTTKTYWTTNSFIKKAQEIHGNRYDYSKTTYIHSHVKVTIICKIHGEFLQLPAVHLRSSGCLKCVQDRHRKTYEQSFFKKVIKIHKNKYDYSKSKYKNFYTKLKIICPIHGSFWQNPSEHLHGNGCSKCGRIRTINSRRGTTRAFIKKAKEIHGEKYRYEKSVYSGYLKELTITCPIHGDITIRARTHLAGAGCPSCSHTSRRGSRKGHTCTIQRRISKDDFLIETTSHRSNQCLLCGGSKGEQMISKILQYYGITFRREYKFSNCYYKSKDHPLRFDFAIFSKKDQGSPLFLIEFQGAQHYSDVSFFAEGQSSLRKRDRIKRNFCKKNNLLLYEIPFSERKLEKKVISILKEQHLLQRPLLMSIDPGIKNCAILLLTLKGNILYSDLITQTLLEPKNSDLFSSSVSKIKKYIKRLNTSIIEPKTAITYERFVPRNRLNKGNLSELTNILIGMLTIGIKAKNIYPVMAATWKVHAKKFYDYTDNMTKNLPPHLIDAYCIGLYCLEKRDHITAKKAKKLLHDYVHSKKRDSWKKKKGIWVKETS